MPFSHWSPTVVQAGGAEWAGVQGAHSYEEPSRSAGPDASPDNPAWPAHHWPALQSRRMSPVQLRSCTQHPVQGRFMNSSHTCFFNHFFLRASQSVCVSLFIIWSPVSVYPLLGGSHQNSLLVLFILLSLNLGWVRGISFPTAQSFVNKLWRTRAFNIPWWPICLATNPILKLQRYCVIVHLY